jgi:hypothetical protein
MVGRMIIGLGVLVAIAGWVWLLSRPDVDVPELLGLADPPEPSSGEFLSLHMLSVAENVILLGYALITWGAITTGFEQLMRTVGIIGLAAAVGGASNVAITPKDDARPARSGREKI